VTTNAASSGLFKRAGVVVTFILGMAMDVVVVVRMKITLFEGFDGYVDGIKIYPEVDVR
jgi:hypothetical protein